MNNTPIRKLKKVIYYKMAGMGAFPLDMLRYDVAFVAPDSLDQRHSQTYPKNPKGTLVAFVSYEQRDAGVYQAHPTVKRWQSFLWNIVQPMDEAELEKSIGDDWVTWRTFQGAQRLVTFKEFLSETR